MIKTLLNLIAEGVYIGLVASVAFATIYTAFVLSLLIYSIFE